MSNSRPFMIAWAALVMLLGLTVLASFLLSGPASLAASMGIALAKAALIFWFFMHLGEEGGLVRLFAIAVAAWLVILALLMASDYATRPWLQKYAQPIEEQTGGGTDQVDALRIA